MRTVRRPTKPLLLALVALCLLTGAGRAQKQSLEVAGHGQTVVDAEQDALGHARDWLAGLLRERRPDVEWLPTTKEIRDGGFVQPVSHDPAYPSLHLGPHHRVTMRVEVSEAQLWSMVQKDLLRQRHGMTLKLLIVLVLLLGSLALYFKLEEATRGYSSGILKAGLFACLAAVGVGTWWFW